MRSNMDKIAEVDEDQIELGNVTDRLFQHSDSNISFPRVQSQYEPTKNEILTSFRLILNSKLNAFLICGPLVVFGTAFSLFGEALCFCLAGLALIPCAERLSFITEQVAEHTNETIGALLNATFGNAPEFLISSAALRSGFYRLVQLTLLGSMLTNLLFVFGVSCFIGGLQWQVQDLRITSGNVSIGMLLMATMGLILPAALKLGNENRHVDSVKDIDDEITQSDINFSRANALFMVVGYIGYLIFQLGSHKEEFDYEGEEYAAFGGGHNIVRTPHVAPNPKKPIARRNLFCRKHCFLMKYCPVVQTDTRILDDTEDSTVYTTVIQKGTDDAQCTIKQYNRTSLDMNRSSTQRSSTLVLMNDSHGSLYDEVINLRGSNIKCNDSDHENLDEGRLIMPYLFKSFEYNFLKNGI